MVKPPEIIKIKQTRRVKEKRVNGHLNTNILTKILHRLFTSHKSVQSWYQSKKGLCIPPPLAVGPSGPCAPGDRSFCRSLVKSSEWLGRVARFGQDSIGPAGLGPGRGLATG